MLYFFAKASSTNSNDVTIIIAIVSGISTVAVALISGFMSYRSIKNNNDISLKKLELDNELKSVNSNKDNYNKTLNAFVENTISYINIKFLGYGGDLKYDINFQSSFVQFLPFCTIKQQDLMNDFYDFILNTHKDNDDYGSNRETSIQLIQRLRNLIISIELNKDIPNK